MKPSEGFVLGSNPSGHRYFFVLFVSILLSFALCASPLELKSNTLFLHGSKLWLVSNSGEAVALPYEFEAANEIHHQGTTSAVISPDQRLVAYTKKNDLWLLNLKDETIVQATKHGRPLTSNMAAVYVLVTAWSYDGKKILYSVAHSDQEEIENSGELEIPSAPYGYRIYDLETKTSAPVRIPGDFEAWLPNGDFLLTSAESDLFDRHLLRLRAGEDLPQLAAPMKGFWGESSLSPDGRELLIAFSESIRDGNKQKEGDSPQLSSRIIKMNLRTGKLTSISPIGFWSEYQMPAYSPSGKRIAYIRQEELDESGYIRGKLVVDGKPVVDMPGIPFEYHWIDDNSISLIEEASAIVVDATTGQERGHSRFVALDPTAASTSPPK